MTRANRLNRAIIIAFALLILTPIAASAQQRSGIGLGFMAGEPTGISAISWLGRGNALDLVVAWAFGGEGSFYLHTDYQYHSFVDRPLTVFVGLGGYIRLADNPVLGFRVPLGLTWLFQDVPLDFFVEVAPGMSLVPATDFSIQGGIGFRFYLR
jgi:hypothetical protein